MSTTTVPESAVVIDGEEYDLAGYQQQWTTCECTDHLHSRPQTPWFPTRLGADRAAAYEIGARPHVVTRLVAESTWTAVTR